MVIKYSRWFLWVALIVTQPVWAEDCDKKPTKDSRLMCEAAEQNNPRFCDEISSKDQRLYCQARIQPNSYTCEKITSSSVRFDCLALVKSKQFNLIWSFNSTKPKS